MEKKGLVKSSDFILVGGGGHCRSCINSILKSGNSVLGIVDGFIEHEVLGFPILGSDEEIPQLSLSYPEASFIVTVGMVNSTSGLRKKLYKKLILNNINRQPAISKNSYVSSFSEIGLGTVVLEAACVNANAVIGENVIINTAAIIEHDVYVGSHTHISTNAILNGGVKVGESCMIGSGAIILQGLKIVSNTTIAAGSVVTKDITQAGTWIGIPARRKDY